MNLAEQTRNRIIVLGTWMLLLLAYHLIFHRFFPGPDGTIGHDYSRALPKLLDGYFWALNNGIFSRQWFTPAFCGGVPAFANPQDFYYSLPQWLTQITDPLNAVYITLLVFASVGFFGTYLLLRVSFKLSLTTALLGAALFMFNGFFSHRMLVGHMGFISFMLMPLVAHFMLRPLPATGRPWKHLILDASFAGACLGYMIYSGMIHPMMPLLLAIIAIALIHSLMFGSGQWFWLRFIGAGIISLGLSVAKLTADLAFISNFDRSDYLLPGASSLWGAFTLVFRGLFLTPSSDMGRELLNVQWLLNRHEFEYGVTVIPLLMLAVSAIFAGKRLLKKPRFSPSHWLMLAILAIILLIPLALNVYTPEWNALLKQIPLLRNSSNLVRWFCLYIPLVILVSAIAFDKTPIPLTLRHWAAALAIVAVPVANAMVNQDYYKHQMYNPSRIVKAYHKYSAQGHPPEISRIVAFTDSKGRLTMPPDRDDTLVLGASQLACYEPVFGYRLEHFPVKPLRPGPVNMRIGNVFNIKNPVCYFFGAANQCRPGDHFTRDDAANAKAFISYKPITFKRPLKQHIADAITLVTLFGLPLFWLVVAVLRIRSQSHQAKTTNSIE
jgi:hypothetical protein